MNAVGRILFVDDEPKILMGYQRMLRRYAEQWEMEFVDSPTEALKCLQQQAFDVVVTDVRMPEMSGIELLSRIKQQSKTQDIQVIVVTGETDRNLKVAALNHDAADLLNKPVNMLDLEARIRSAFRVKHYADLLKAQKQALEKRVRERTAELNASRNEILWRLGKAAEFRDEETGNHVIRVGCYSRVVAETMGLAPNYCETLFLAAPLHDIGKIGVPDSILRKPGKLDAEQWNVMRQHCEMGVAILTDQSKFTHVASRYFCELPPEDRFEKNPVIAMAIEIARSHHEKWNGRGYPAGLAGDEIPLCGRIVAIADVYDALRSERPYKQPFSVEKSIDILRHEAGEHFDPAVAEAFFDSLDSIRAIEEEFHDDDATPAIACDLPVDTTTVAPTAL